MMHPTMPRRGELIWISCIALVLRLIVFGGAMVHGHLSLLDYTSKGDTASYLAMASAISGERSLGSLSEYDRRVFPGYPAMIAVVHRIGVSLPMAALSMTWIAAAVAAGVAGKLFNDARVGWAMVCLVPHYLINSSMGMSEAPLLAVVCLALLASQRDQLILAGVMFGFAGMVRPMACFALAGLVFALCRDRAWRSAVKVAAAAGGMFLLEVLMMQLWTGNAVHGVQVYAQHPDAYGGHMIEWPFESLLTTPAKDHATVGRVIYIWVHVIIVLAACGVIGDRALRSGRARPRDGLSFVWLMGNTVFVLCVGSVWGFRHFPRFCVPAEPALFWTLRNWLPRGWGWWMVIALGCVAMAIPGVIVST